MRTTEQYSITLPRQMAKIVEAKVASGVYASVSEVVREGVRSLVARDAALEKWLRSEVAASVRHMEAHPETGIPLDKAFARVRAKIRKPRASKK
ncbi:MAG: type II toxin-antitoxin system ParD family antitoxin [Alphaproteobacteria bacterium]|nr:type II toxin-antitoxin system ParD family antitoxin [Alphaproteobacteria bacterium]